MSHVSDIPYKQTTAGILGHSKSHKRLYIGIAIVVALIVVLFVVLAATGNLVKLEVEEEE